MRNHARAWLTAIAAAALLATAVGTASARNLSISNQNIREVFHPLIFFSGETRLSCPVTVEGSFHYRTTAKTLNALAGYITRAEVAETMCSGSGLLAGARVRANRETLPHHITYGGFTGTLPNIGRIIEWLHTDFTIFNIPLAGACRYEGSARGFFLPAEHEIEADRTTAIPLRTGNGFCPSNGNFEGKTRATVLGTTTPVSVTLI